MACCRTGSVEASSVDRCRRCGARGRPVPRETMASLLDPDARRRIAGDTYYFDRTPECEVVYFSNDSGSSFTKRDLLVRVGLKETTPPVPVCYCFGHTAESLREEIARTGRTTIPERIRAEIQAGNCRCEIRNPSGACCLGEVRRVLAEIQEEPPSRETVAESEKG